MNENVERILDELDGFRIAGEITYTAYSGLHDSISELNDLLKEQEEQIEIKTENFNRLVAKIGVMPEIVRCAKCEHANISASGLIKCAGVFRCPDWFCADGKRRGEV